MYTSKTADMLVAAGTAEVTRVTRIGSPAAACSSPADFDVAGSTGVVR
jgi:hypothetical protein